MASARSKHLSELREFLVAAGIQERHAAVVARVFHEQEQCLYTLFLSAGVKIIPANAVGRVLVPENVKLWRSQCAEERRAASLAAAHPCPPTSHRCRRQKGGAGMKECRELARLEVIQRSESPFESFPKHPPACSATHVAVCCKGSPEGMTRWEAATDAIVGDFGERNPDWRNKDWLKQTTHVLFIAEHEGERQAVATAVYTHTNDCAIVVHLFCVRKDSRRRGHGRTFLRLLEEHAKERGKALLVEYNSDAGDSRLFWNALGYSKKVGFPLLGKENSGKPAGLRRWYPQTPCWNKPSEQRQSFCPRAVESGTNALAILETSCSSSRREVSEATNGIDGAAAAAAADVVSVVCSTCHSSTQEKTMLLCDERDDALDHALTDDCMVGSEKMSASLMTIGNPHFKSSGLKLKFETMLTDQGLLLKTAKDYCCQIQKLLAGNAELDQIGLVVGSALCSSDDKENERILAKVSKLHRRYTPALSKLQKFMKDDMAGMADDVQVPALTHRTTAEHATVVEDSSELVDTQESTAADLKTKLKPSEQRQSFCPRAVESGTNALAILETSCSSSRREVSEATNGIDGAAAAAAADVVSVVCSTCHSSTQEKTMLLCDERDDALDHALTDDCMVGSEKNVRVVNDYRKPALQKLRFEAEV